MYRRYIKRGLDFSCSLLAIIILSPVMAIIAILIRVRLGCPILFRQQRPGRKEKIFTLLKFRTMTDERDEQGNLLPDQERLTRLGRALRATSLDELPELLNIIKGDMSLIGPRPLLVQYLTLYDDNQRRRHDTRPGLTGLAQVSGRNAIDWMDKLNLDIHYVDHITFLLDLKIILRTISKVMMKEGIEFTQNKSIYECLSGNKANAEREHWSMNILITSIGQRGYLIDHFRESSNGRYGIYAADASRYAPALQKADKAFILPMANAPSYYSELLRICKENDIRGIISINDLELPVLASYKGAFAQNGIIAIVSSPEVVELCFDKYKTYLFCIQHDIPTPKTYLWKQKEELLLDIDAGIIRFPIIAKPRRGSRSIGIHLVNNVDQLVNDIDNMRVEDIPEDEKLMFQEYIDSEQYSIHIFNDERSTPVYIVTMVNMIKHLGETFHVKTIRDAALTKLGLRIGENLKHVGPLSADVHQRENGEYVVLEFNPRISGCYSLSHYAGADFPEKIFNLINGVPINTEKVDGFEDDVLMLKQYSTEKLSEEMIAKKLSNP